MGRLLSKSKLPKGPEVKKLFTYLFKKYCLRKHKFGRSDIVRRVNNHASKGEITQLFYDKHLNPVYQYRPYGIGKLDYIVDDGGPEFDSWEEHTGIAAGTVDMSENVMQEPEKLVSIKDAKTVKVSKLLADKIVSKHKKATAKAKKK